MIVFTISVDRTTMNTAQKARQKWHLFRPTSRNEWLIKNWVLKQQPIFASAFQVMLSQTSSCMGCKAVHPNVVLKLTVHICQCSLYVKL